MRTVCGLDVHKDTIYLCILCGTGEIFEHVYGVLTCELKRKTEGLVSLAGQFVLYL